MKNLWNLLENVLHFIIFKIFKMKLSESKWKQFCQFIQFGMVGVSNTLISYVVYALLIMVEVNYLIASVAGFVVSVANAFYWNDRYVFKKEQKEERSKWRTFVKTFTAYAGTGLLLSNILLVVWVDVIGVSQLLGPIINLLITIPLNFILNKFWAFRQKK